MTTSRQHLNGADLHGEHTARPDATSCWLAALEQRRQQLLGQVRSLDVQVVGATKIEDTRLSLVRLAEAVAEADAADLERLRDRLDAYDAETEGLLAESGGRVKRVRAQLAHRRNPAARGGLPAGPEDLAALEAELAAAEKADGEQLARRLAAREPLREAWLTAARRGLQAGMQFLALTEPDVPALQAARSQAAEARRELDHLNSLAALALAAEDRKSA